jgi:hypothetical protein
MTMSNTLSHLIELNVESTADWRRMKAVEFPDDRRNLKAAEELDQLAKELGELGGSDLDRRLEVVEAIVEKNGWWEIHDGEWLSEELRGVCFRWSYSGRDFLERYVEKLEAEIQRRIDHEIDDAIETPDLAAHVENDPAVKAAKLAYEEARAKAYAEARKRI